MTISLWDAVIVIWSFTMIGWFMWQLWPKDSRTGS